MKFFWIDISEISLKFLVYFESHIPSIIYEIFGLTITGLEHRITYLNSGHLYQLINRPTRFEITKRLTRNVGKISLYQFDVFQDIFAISILHSPYLNIGLYSLVRNRLICVAYYSRPQIGIILPLIFQSVKIRSLVEPQILKACCRKNVNTDVKILFSNFIILYRIFSMIYSIYLGTF